MRVMVFVKADKKTEDGAIPSTELLTAMQAYNQELADAGVILMGDGLTPSSRGVRVHFGKPDEIAVEDGPFDNPEDLVAGFWIWKVDSVDHAVGWLKRSPFQHAVVEVRPFFELADFAGSMTPEIEARDRALRTRLESR